MSIYTITSRVAYAPCGSRAPVRLVRDVPAQMQWEAFDEQSLRPYFANNLQLFLRRIAEFGDLSNGWSTEQDHELVFMLESLIHARHALGQAAR